MRLSLAAIAACGGMSLAACAKPTPQPAGPNVVTIVNHGQEPHQTRVRLPAPG